MKRISVNITDAEYQQLLALQKFHNELQSEEGVKYSYSDILRIGLGYAYRREIIEEVWKYDLQYYTSN